MLSRCNTSCKMLEQERLQKMSDIAPVGLVWNLNHLQQIKHRLNKPMGNLYGSFSYFTKIWWPHHTGSADGIHSFVAGFPLLEGWHADATLVSELSSNELSLFFSILMKPVPVCTRPMGDWNNKSCTIWLAKAWNNSTRTELVPCGVACRHNWDLCSILSPHSPPLLHSRHRSVSIYRSNSRNHQTNWERPRVESTDRSKIEKYIPVDLPRDFVVFQTQGWNLDQCSWFRHSTRMSARFLRV